MEKLKDLYLNDLIERDVYERDYSALKGELQKAERVAPKKKPVDLAAVADLSLIHIWERGFTQEKLAKTIGISECSMNFSLNNKRNVRQDEISRCV